jgi:hypothetical protein
VASEVPKARIDDALFAACALAWGASLIHVEAAIGHLGESKLYALLFELTACAQAVWGVAVYRSQRAGLLRIGAAGSLAIVAVWVMSRTSGLPFGPEPWEAESIGSLDLIATLDEIALAVIAGLRLSGRHVPRALMGVVLLLILLSALSPTSGAHVH